MSSKILEVARIVGDERDIAFYIVDALNRNTILTGSVLSCKFSASGESDVITPITLALGDGRAHIAVSTAQVANAITWQMMITGTDGSGADIAPIVGSLVVT